MVVDTVCVTVTVAVAQSHREEGGEDSVSAPLQEASEDVSIGLKGLYGVPASQVDDIPVPWMVLEFKYGVGSPEGTSDEDSFFDRTWSV